MDLYLNEILQYFSLMHQFLLSNIKVLILTNP